MSKNINKMKNIKDHFDEEAKIFDELILKVIPYYQEMVDAIASSIPFTKNTAVKVLDLGCGTGTISQAILTNFPKAKSTLIDISEKMLEIAKSKIGEKSILNSHCIDFYNFNIAEKYDVIVSSLALHHLITDQDKIKFYTKIFEALNAKGIFLNADVILGSNLHFQEIFMKKWIAYMSKSYDMKEIQSKWLVKYKNEDSPAQLLKQTKWLENIGFIDVDIIWKYYNFAVYGGMKKK